jgi:protein SCO1/2
MFKQKSKTILLIALLLALGIGMAVLILSYRNAQPTFRGIVIEPPYPVGDFTVQSDQGEIHLSDFRGKVVLLYFGYLYCPDVCPTTMVKISQALDQVGNDASKVQTIFISVDPERDTPQTLGEYARAFSPEFIGATSTPENIAVIARQFGIYYEKRPAPSGTGYLIDHTAVVWILDPLGNLYLEWPFGFEVEDMAADLKAMFKKLRASTKN